jgi:TrmH family RNA methyltransferase
MLILEGSKPIQEVLPFVKKIIYTSAYAPYLTFDVPERWHVTEWIMKKISGNNTPEGVIAEVQMPSFSSLKESKNILVLDGISDPGNMGTLIRTALAFGWDGIYILPTSCDPYNEKVLRAARGAHFKIPLRRGNLTELALFVKQGHFQAWVADLQGQTAQSVTSKNRKVLIMGNEAHGPSPEVFEFAESISIPMIGEMESLNVAVAGGILLYALMRND